MNLGIGFLYQRHPEFLITLTMTKNVLHALLNRNSAVYYNVAPAKIFEEAENVETFAPVHVENRRVDALRQVPGCVCVNFSFLELAFLYAFRPASQQFISCCQD